MTGPRLVPDLGDEMTGALGRCLRFARALQADLSRTLGQSAPAIVPDLTGKLQLLGRPGHQDPCPGLWRRGGIRVASADGGTEHEAPPLVEVPTLMAELVDSLNDARGLPPIVAAAMAHLNPVSIQPFGDGNGRMSRALQSPVLARGGAKLAPEFLSIEEWLAHNRAAYYGTLAATRVSWTPERSARGRPAKRGGIHRIGAYWCHSGMAMTLRLPAELEAELKLAADEDRRRLVIVLDVRGRSGRVPTALKGAGPASARAPRLVGTMDRPVTAFVEAIGRFVSFSG